MASFVSAAVGISLAVVLLAMAWARETPLDRALYHAALTGGATAVLGRYWIRQMIVAARATQKKREEEERRKEAERATASDPAAMASHPAQSPAKAG